MSLINQALRRANPGPARGAAGGPELRAVEPSRYPGGEVGLLLPSLLALVTGFAIALLWAGFRAGAVVQVRARSGGPAAQFSQPLTSTASPTQATAPHAAAAATAVASNAAAPIPPTASSPVPTLIPAAAPAPAAAVASTPLTVSESNTIAPAAPAPRDYKIQAIFYRSDRPAAVINGRTVSVGDRVEDARVESIGTDAATLVDASGREIRLELN